MRPSTFTSNCRWAFSRGIASSGTERAVSGVVHQHVDPAERREAGGDCGVDGGDVLHVEAGHQGVVEARQLGLIFGRAHRRDDIPAVGLEQLGGGTAEAAGGAGDQDGLGHGLDRRKRRRPAHWQCASSCYLITPHPGMEVG
jgi:hypothetical protein